ncbi:protein phosphatase 2C domain-containing protein [Nevskia soli]|jgi:protein phosphatase|uniref:protein phosphatase 2C domain-containing protein n=1 Tax=Nevskia soli TaxID=418856 RepID=UPI0015D7CF2A|nr:protein phosphatase 2C domain-containing protein [Nevskia soli]
MRNVCARTDTGKVRARNEDRFFVDAEAGIYLLADGMGGARGGAEASRLAVESVSETLLATPLRDAATLLSAIEKANAVILNEARNNPELQGMGTTLVAALDRGDSFTIASVGDSRAYLWAHGELRLITKDQTWVQEVGRPLGLDEEALQKHPLRHVLTMALGVSEALDVRLYDIRTEPAAFLLLSSDGLHGLVTPEQIQRILGDNPEAANTLEEKCLHLINAARAAGGPDNITAVLIAAS